MKQKHHFTSKVDFNHKLYASRTFSVQFYLSANENAAF